MPNSARIAAARRLQSGRRFPKRRLVSRMPGTAAGSMQWSPFHASRLSTIVSRRQATERRLVRAARPLRVSDDGIRRDVFVPFDRVHLFAAEHPR